MKQSDNTNYIWLHKRNWEFSYWPLFVPPDWEFCDVCGGGWWCSLWEPWGPVEEPLLVLKLKKYKKKMTISEANFSSLNHWNNRKTTGITCFHSWSKYSWDSSMYFYFFYQHEKNIFQKVTASEHFQQFWNGSISSVDRTPIDQSGPGNHEHEGVFHTPKAPKLVRGLQTLYVYAYIFYV